MKRYLLYICLLFLATVSRAADVDNGYRIKDWVYEAQVHENNTWTVKETMTVDFLEERHGIYRYIPRKFVIHRPTDGDEVAYTYMTSIGEIGLNDYEFYAEGNDDEQENLVIRIGSEDVLLTGEHTYVIQYELRYPDDRYPDSDELLHTVLGPDCNTTIGHFRFRISFDKELPGDVAFQAVSGSWGGERNELGVELEVDGNSVSGELGNIAPFNGITLTAILPEGYWKDAWHVSPTKAHVFVTLFFVFLLITLWYLVRNHRKQPLVVIEYSAPDGISSAEVGVIIDDTTDLSDLTSLIVWWASKGYLKIREVKDGEEDDIELIRLKSLPHDAPIYQKRFWRVFFPGSKDNVLLSELGDRHKQIEASREALDVYFNGERALVQASGTALLTGFAMLVAGILALGNSSSVDSWYGPDLMFSTLLWAGPVFFTIIVRMTLSDYDMMHGPRFRHVQYAIILVLAMLSLFLFNRNYSEHDYLLPGGVLNLVVAGGWTVALLSGRFLRDTEYRREKMSLLLGFREFIEKAEMPMLKAQVDENPSYFYDVLPYAMVFGLTQKWKEQFANIDMPAPDWYECSGSNPNLSSLMVADRLSNQMSSTINKAVEVSSHDPNHTSSGSGSFVGGGGGGGGVGSW